VFEIGAASLEILLPWIVGLYFFHPDVKDDYHKKHDIVYVVYFLLFFISFCAWVKGYMYARAIENIAKEMRYDLYHNYVVNLEKIRLMKRIQINLASAFGKKNEVNETASPSLKFKKTDEFSITEVDEQIETIMSDIKQTAAQTVKNRVLIIISVANIFYTGSYFFGSLIAIWIGLEIYHAIFHPCVDKAELV